MLKRAALRDMPTVMARCLADSSRFSAVDHKQIDHFANLREARVDSLSTDASGEPLSVPGPGRRRLHRRPHLARARRRPRRAHDRCLTACLFCRIAAGGEPAHFVCEDETCVAFLDTRPLFHGHTLLMPRDHHETLGDLPDDLVAPLFTLAQRLSIGVRDAMGAQGSFVAMNNIVSQSVPHLHYPRRPAGQEGRPARVLLAAHEVRVRRAGRGGRSAHPHGAQYTPSRALVVMSPL